jgi:hypothetical protein
MKYVYSGPTSGATLDDGTEVMFFDGKEVELPETNEYVKTLVALGHLKAVASVQEPVASKKTKKEVTENAS